jgi:hypothetical protein
MMNVDVVKLEVHLHADPVLRRIWGFGARAHVPCEASFSNWFATFEEISLAEVRAVEGASWVC